MFPKRLRASAPPCDPSLTTGLGLRARKANVRFCTAGHREGSYAGRMMKNKITSVAFALALVGAVSASPAIAQTNLNNRTVVTFSQPVEVPGKVLPAGTYTFELNESMANRHIVQIFDQAGTKIVALVLAVPNRRLTPTTDTVIKFAEVAAGQPQALRAWFYPGQTVGQEMVYPKTRARELAATSNVIVPAVEDSFYADAKVDTMKTADVVSVTPDPTPTPVGVEPVRTEPTPAVAPVEPTRRRALPKTASTLPLIALIGFGTLAFGLVLRRFSVKPATR